MQIVETIFYFIVTLGVLVFVHELGHFLAAKMCRMRVDVFSIGFPPRAFGKRIGETDYCISWIPIGGYVKIAGMIDESLDTEHLNQPPQPWEFRAKPIWQRMLVISAGVIMNVLLAVLIFWGINYIQGKTVWETTEIGYVAEGSTGERVGLRAGDRILSINGVAIKYWDEIANHVYMENMGQDLHVVLLREGKQIELFIPRSSIPDPKPNEPGFGITPTNTEIVVTTVEPGKPAGMLGLKPNDVILKLNGEPVRYDQKVKEVVQANAGVPIEVEWRRGDSLMSGTTTPTADGKIGISYRPRYTGPITREQYSLIGALPEGLKDIVNLVRLSFQQLWQIFSGRAAFSESVAGPIRIAQMATQTAEMGVMTYLGFMALLSISLAIINILPFPALDGGHLLFLVYEGLFRREIPAKVKIALQKAGFVLLLALMAFVVYNDIIHF